MAENRIQRQYKNIKQHPIQGITVQLNESDCKEWKCVLQGPIGSPYEGGKFKFRINFGKYPFEAYKVFFETKTYHPNIDQSNSGNAPAFLMFLCCGCYKGIIGDNWRPTRTVRQLLELIIREFKQPNSMGLCVEHHHVGLQFQKNRKEFDQMARTWTKQYAQQ